MSTISPEAAEELKRLFPCKSMVKHITHERVEADLYLSMSEEALAARLYRERADFAESKGDSKTAELYRHIAGEEDGHYKEFETRLEDVAAAFLAEGCSCGCKKGLSDKEAQKWFERDMSSPGPVNVHPGEDY